MVIANLTFLGQARTARVLELSWTKQSDVGLIALSFSPPLSLDRVEVW